ncbi:hypothetical protein BC828DRAFT_381364 [Blastocladiella britannica]|nr:hypothetical protein BC828DRAFT_381364 [Blastocladiella britannica]
MLTKRRLLACSVLATLVFIAWTLAASVPDPDSSTSAASSRSPMASLRSSNSNKNALPSTADGGDEAEDASFVDWVRAKTAKAVGDLQGKFSGTGASSAVVNGKNIMPKMGNETLRAELGRASWQLIHTMGNTYPNKPKPDERSAMGTFIHLLGRVYPCGDCAQHFQQMLQMHPPEPHLGSRDDLSQYLCKLHNKVNLRLAHPIFDCNKVGDRWKCGCADADEPSLLGNATAATSTSANSKPTTPLDPAHALRPHVPDTSKNGKFAPRPVASGAPSLDGFDLTEPEEDETTGPITGSTEGDLAMLAKLSPIERAMRMEFRSMFSEDYDEALRRAQEVPPRYPAPVVRPAMDVHGNVIVAANVTSSTASSSSSSALPIAAAAPSSDDDAPLPEALEVERPDVTQMDSLEQAEQLLERPAPGTDD